MLWPPSKNTVTHSNVVSPILTAFSLTHLSLINRMSSAMLSRSVRVDPLACSLRKLLVFHHYVLVVGFS